MVCEIESKVTMEDREIIAREVVRLRKKGLRNHEIQEKLGLTESGLSEMIMRLIYEGKITRQFGSNFRRKEVEKRGKQIAKLRQAGLTDKEIAEKVGITETTVSEYVRQLGLPKRPSSHYYRQPEESDEQEVVRMYKDKRTEGEIAQNLGLSPRSIRYIIRFYRFDLKRQRTEAILCMRKAGASQAEISRSLGVLATYVYRVLKEFFGS